MTVLRQRVWRTLTALYWGKGESMQDFIKINREDMAAVALKPLEKGTSITVDHTEITLLEDIPQGHKFALCDIVKGTPVVKYGATIGYAKEDILKGNWIHVHNLKTSLGEVPKSGSLLEMWRKLWHLPILTAVPRWGMIRRIQEKFWLI